MSKKIDKKKSAAAKKAWATRRENAGKKNNSPKEKNKKIIEIPLVTKPTSEFLKNNLIELKNTKEKSIKELESLINDVIVFYDKKISESEAEIKKHELFLKQELLNLQN